MWNIYFHSLPKLCKMYEFELCKYKQILTLFGQLQTILKKMNCFCETLNYAKIPFNPELLKFVNMPANFWRMQAGLMLVGLQINKHILFFWLFRQHFAELKIIWGFGLTYPFAYFVTKLFQVNFIRYHRMSCLPNTSDFNLIDSVTSNNYD